MLAQNLQVESSSIIERPHRMTKADDTSKPRTVVCTFYEWKVREAIPKTARRTHIYEDLGGKAMATQREPLPRLKQGKIVYFSHDKLVIRDRPPGARFSTEFSSPS